jgi:hypothetical protein
VPGSGKGRRTGRPGRLQRWTRQRLKCPFLQAPTVCPVWWTPRLQRVTRGWSKSPSLQRLAPHPEELQKTTCSPWRQVAATLGPTGGFSHGSVVGCGGSDPRPAPSRIALRIASPAGPAGDHASGPIDRRGWAVGSLHRGRRGGPGVHPGRRLSPDRRAAFPRARPGRGRVLAGGPRAGAVGRVGAYAQPIVRADRRSLPVARVDFRRVVEPTRSRPALRARCELGQSPLATARGSVGCLARGRTPGAGVDLGGGAHPRTVGARQQRARRTTARDPAPNAPVNAAVGQLVRAVPTRCATRA